MGGALDFSTNVNSIYFKYVLNKINLLAALCPMAPREKALSLFSLMCLGVNPDIVNLNNTSHTWVKSEI